MQTPQLKICTDCGTLQELYNQINCSIFQLIRNKWTNQTYNTDGYFSNGQYKTLLRLKRIVYKRMFNQSYPSTSYSNQDVVSIVSRILYKQRECTDCPCEDFSDFLIPCVCYNVANNGGPSSPTIAFEYKGCNNTTETSGVGPGQSVDICALENGIAMTDVVIDRLVITLIGDCSDCPTTSTTTSLLP